MNDAEPSTDRPSEADSTGIPLCVDLDGTLVRTDTLLESVLSSLRSRPLAFLRACLSLAGGRARFKASLAAAVRPDPESLPYNPELLEFVRKQRHAGRRLLLVTASHAAIAEAVAEHLGLFDEVIATEGTRNLKGEAKRLELVRRFGERGFDYAGDSKADLAVWPAAREAIVVNARPRVVRRLGARAGRVLDPPDRRSLATLLRAMRLRQWVKNLLLFLPMLLAHRYFDFATLTRAAIGFVAFGLCASAVYVFNDLLDVEADRHHPVKRLRPFASGALPLSTGFVLGPLLVASSFALALVLPRAFLLVLLFYFGVTSLYSLVLKQIALVDVLVLAALYTTRIIAGQAATGVAVSEWLLAFSMFLFLSLGAVKRYGELLRLRSSESGDAQVRRRGYFASDLELIVQMGISSGYLAVLVLALYITSDSVARLYHRPHVLWLVCPLILYWVSRIWLLAHRGQVQDDPLTFAVRDRVTWIVGALSAIVVVAASGSS